MSDSATEKTSDKEPTAATAPAPAAPATTGGTQEKARAALRGVWGSFSALATRVVHAVESEAATLRSEQAALAREAALAQEPPPAALPPWEDLGSGATAAQRAAVEAAVRALTQSAANFVTIPVATQREATAAAAGAEASAAARKHAANVVEVPERDGFSFELGAALPAAEAALRADTRLADMRRALVPRRVGERNFWRNWLWRVAAIKAAHGVQWPTPGIAPLKGTSIAPLGETVPEAHESAAPALEDEITLTLTEISHEDEEEERQKQEKQKQKQEQEQQEDDAWAKEVEEALAEKP